MPFPILGVDSDNGSEFINYHLLTWCEKRKITFTRSRPGTSNDGAHVEHKNWAIVRTVVGYHRYDTTPELVLLNTIWALQSKLANYLRPQHKLVSKVRTGAKVSKKYDRATSPRRRHRRGQGDPRPHLPHHQPRSRPTLDLGPDQRAAHPHHQPRPRHRLRGHPQVSQRINRCGHLDVRQQARALS